MISEIGITEPENFESGISNLLRTLSSIVDVFCVPGITALRAIANPIAQSGGVVKYFI